MNPSGNSSVAAPPLSLGAFRDWEVVGFLALFLAGGAVFLLGGPNLMVIALAVLPLPYLLSRPKTALWYAFAFLPLAAAFDPQTYPVRGEPTPRQMYYWAAGLLIVLIPVGLRVAKRLRPFSLRRLRQLGIPASVVALFAVSLAASLQGLRFGNSLSYVLRQFYGVLLLCVGFVAVLLFVQGASEVRMVLRRMRWLVLFLAAYTATLYLQERFRVGFFKANISLFSATLAVYCAGEFLCAQTSRSRIRWGLLTLLFLVHPILFLSRGAVGLAGIVMLAGLGLRTRSRATKYLMFGGALAFLVASVTLNLFAGLNHFLQQYSLIHRLVPASIIQDPDALTRISQLYAAVLAARRHPFLGLGLGSMLTWYQPTIHGFQSAALVDNGYAYILSKMGLLGMAAFAWFAFSVLKRVGFPRRNGLELGLWLVAFFQLLYMVVGGAMVYFVYALWAGITWGFLFKLRSPATSKGRLSRPSGVPAPRKPLEGSAPSAAPC